MFRLHLSNHHINYSTHQRCTRLTSYQLHNSQWPNIQLQRIRLCLSFRHSMHINQRTNRRSTSRHSTSRHSTSRAIYNQCTKRRSTSRRSTSRRSTSRAIYNRRTNCSLAHRLSQPIN
ncbi:hypothetical protein NQZ68_033880 [Dissostichus eleginoides]|nr:hypothetical protein NQZ68_036929 [Dissostichus eleginoides]KAI9545748.1 hypothetical protein NQZ68_033880 [Dissostichus eleginoides]